MYSRRWWLVEQETRAWVRRWEGAGFELLVIFSPLYTNQDIWSWRLITLRTYTSWECKYELTRVEAVLIIRGGLMVDAGEREWETDRDGAFSHVRAHDDTGGTGHGLSHSQARGSCGEAQRP